MTVDSGPADLTKPQSFNRYTYAWNDPVNGYDPTGQTTVCVGQSVAPAGINDASNPCAIGIPINWPFAPVSTVREWDDIHGVIDRRLEAAAAIFSDLDGVLAWEPRNASATSFSVDISEATYVYANNLAPLAVPVIVIGWKAGVVTVGIAGGVLYNFGKWLSAAKKWKAGSFPTVPEVQQNCKEVGPPVVVPSTSVPGGQSIEQEYLCPDGQSWTIHTIRDKNGKITDIHVREGRPKYGN